MKKVLWYGEYLNPTGFAQVTKSLVGYLKNDLDITVLDWQKRLADNIDNPMVPVDFDGIKLLGCLGEKDAEAALQMQFMNIHKYDCVFIINDVWNIDFTLQILKFREYKGKVICYFPVDARVHDPEWYANFDIVTRAVTYTEFARKVVLQAAPHIESKLSILPHGADPKTFYEITDQSKSEIRESLFGSDAYNDKFIFLNANRNQPRKRLDITMEAFSYAAKNADDMRLYMHCGNTDKSMHIQKLAKRFGIEEKLIMSGDRNHHGMMKVSTSDLNRIYNACDVGVNSGMGEGWGLFNTEMGALGKLQIVPASSASQELFEGLFRQIAIKAEYTFDNIMTVGAIPDVRSLADLMGKAYRMGAPERLLLCQKTKERFTSPEFLWSNIAQKWKALFLE